jgi:hypothetical protein
VSALVSSNCSLTRQSTETPEKKTTENENTYKGTCLHIRTLETYYFCPYLTEHFVFNWCVLITLKIL